MALQDEGPRGKIQVGEGARIENSVEHLSCCGCRRFVASFQRNMLRFKIFRKICTNPTGLFEHGLGS